MHGMSNMGLEELKPQTLELLLQKSIDNAGDLIELVKQDCPRHDWAISSGRIEIDGNQESTLEIIVKGEGTKLDPPPIGIVILLKNFGYLGEFYEKGRYEGDQPSVVVEAPISTDQKYK